MIRPTSTASATLVNSREAISRAALATASLGSGGVVSALVFGGDVADAAISEERDVFQLALDGRAVLHAHRQPDAAALERLPGLCGRTDQGELFRGAPHQGLDVVDQVVGQAETGSLGLGLRRRVDGHERHVQAAGAGALVVELAALGPAGDVFPADAEPVRHVDVGIDDHASARQAGGGAVEVLAGLDRQRKRQCERQRGETGRFEQLHTECPPAQDAIRPAGSMW